MSMQIIEINQGPKIAYEESGTRVTFGDEVLMLNLARYQRDWPVHLDICSNRDNQLVVGTGTGLYYVAQLDIPAIQYAEPEPVEPAEGEDSTGNQDPPSPLPLNMDEVVLTLWAIDNPQPAGE